MSCHLKKRKRRTRRYSAPKLALLFVLYLLHLAAEGVKKSRGYVLAPCVLVIALLAFGLRSALGGGEPEIILRYEQTAAGEAAVFDAEFRNISAKDAVLTWYADGHAQRELTLSIDSGTQTSFTYEPAYSPYMDESVTVELRAEVGDETYSAQKEVQLSNYSLAEYAEQLTIPESLDLEHAEKTVYGTSGAGRDLTAYTIGDGGRHLLMTFAVHGWEDAWASDGYALTLSAYRLLKDLDEHYDELRVNDWTVTIVPCANPDGLLDGTSEDGVGRRTAYRFDADGDLIQPGIDMNRSFETGFRALTSDRNFTGDTPLGSPEAQALRDLMAETAGGSQDVFIDVHGWYQQVVTNESTNLPTAALLAAFPENTYTYAYGTGFIARYADTLGYEACLFELPAVSSMNDFLTAKYPERLSQGVLDMLTGSY